MSTPVASHTLVTFMLVTKPSSSHNCTLQVSSTCSSVLIPHKLGAGSSHCLAGRMLCLSWVGGVKLVETSNSTKTGSSAAMIPLGLLQGPSPLSQVFCLSYVNLFKMTPFLTSLLVVLWWLFNLSGGYFKCSFIKRKPCRSFIGPRII